MQTSPRRLQVGWYVFQHGNIYQVTGIDMDSGAVTLCDHHTGLVQASSGTALFTGQDVPCLYAPTQVQGKDAANDVHYQAGLVVRRAIAELGGTMPEDLPNADSIKKLERAEKKRLAAPKSKPKKD